jgi:hypothetical protein
MDMVERGTGRRCDGAHSEAAQMCDRLLRVFGDESRAERQRRELGDLKVRQWDLNLGASVKIFEYTALTDARFVSRCSN